MTRVDSAAVARPMVAKSPRDAAWGSGSSALLAQQRERVEHVLDRASEILGWGQPAAQLTADDRAVHHALTRAWQEITDRLTRADLEVGQIAGLVELMGEVRACEDSLHDAQIAAASAAQRRVREVLLDLRDVHTLGELVERTPEVAARLGFDRVLLSRIQETVWVPESMFVAHDERWAQDILEAGRAHLRRFDDSLLETQIVRSDRALLVTEVVGTPRLHTALIAATRTRSYTAAPISVNGGVIGLLHADCYQQDRQARRLDRDLLWLFSDGLGQVISRVGLVEALQSLRARLDRLMGTHEQFGHFPLGGQRAADSIGSVSGAGSASAAPLSGERQERPPFGPLTRRELDVVRLMGQGYTNAQIARRLVISEGTVKSHVKHILRKLDAANRAEAVAIWLRIPARAAVKSSFQGEGFLLKEEESGSDSD
ncbi:MAG TPA: LuxR C-terminal-related transcriptional regulator [Pseudonocardia sp.]